VQVPITDIIGIAAVEVYGPTTVIIMQDNLIVELPKVGANPNILYAVDAVYVIEVCLQDADASIISGVLLGVPVPVIVIPLLLGTEIPPVQVQEPAGIIIVSPSAATCTGPLTI
jgi:Mn2+/Fe2+ NRAMP family transporter